MTIKHIYHIGGCVVTTATSPQADNNDNENGLQFVIAIFVRRLDDVLCAMIVVAL